MILSKLNKKISEGPKIQNIPDEINRLWTSEEKICELEDITRKTIRYKTHKGKDNEETLNS